MAEIRHFFKFLWMVADGDLGYDTPFHGGDRGSNPLGDANISPARLTVPEAHVGLVR